MSVRYTNFPMAEYTVIRESLGHAAPQESTHCGIASAHAHLLTRARQGK